jgi:hypothetical protein
MLVVKAPSIKPTTMPLQIRGFVLCMVRFSVAHALLIFNFAILPKAVTNTILHDQQPVKNPKKRRGLASSCKCRASVVQVSVLTIDTNPSPAFTRPSRNAASSQRLLPARQALRHEAEEFGVPTPP